MTVGEPLGDRPDAPRSVPSPATGKALRLRGLRVCRPGGGVLDALAALDLDLAAGRRAALGGHPDVAAALSTIFLGDADYTGSARLDGVELRDLPGAEVRAAVGLCTADAHVLAATLEANVRVARPGAGAAEVPGACARARLGSREPAFPGGLATRVGRYGVPVPAAGRLRIAMARSLLAGFPVVLLTAPRTRTPATDAALTELLAAATGRTVVLVTHHRPTPGADPLLRGVDQVIGLDGPDAAGPA